MAVSYTHLFDSSAAIGDFVPVDRLKDIQNLNFHLDIDGKTVQRGNTRCV